jgi:alpha-1,2-mannosyltransferase
LVDLETEDQKESYYSQESKEWQVIYSLPFLDSSRSHPLFRAFYVPYVSQQKNKFNSYHLMKRIKN